VAIPGIAQTPAGRDRRVVTVEDGLLYGFGARTPDAIAALIEGFYGGAGRDR
jgi:iron complex transport system substrate-binding protein